MGAGIIRNMFLGHNRTHSAERPGISSRWHQHHGFVATPIVRIPYSNVCDRQITAEQGSLTVTAYVLIDLGIHFREQRCRIEVSAELVLLPRSIPIRLSIYLP